MNFLTQGKNLPERIKAREFSGFLTDYKKSLIPQCPKRPRKPTIFEGDDEDEEDFNEALAPFRSDFVKIEVFRKVSESLAYFGRKGNPKFISGRCLIKI